MTRKWRIGIGLTAWIAFLVGGWSAARREMQSEEASLADVSTGVASWLADCRTELLAESDISVEIVLGTPVLGLGADGQYRQVGVVRNNFLPVVPVTNVASNSATHDGGKKTVALPAYTKKAMISVYSNALPPAGQAFNLIYHRAPTSLGWVASTLVSPERKDKIAKLIAAEWTKHQEETLQSLRPVMQQSVKRAIAAIEAELPRAIARHRHEFTKLGDKYKSEILQKEMLPLVETHILPIVEREAKPLMSDIGQDLWNRVSLWSFAWRYFYDVSPLPQRNAVREEFDRFVELEALPELRSRSHEFATVIEKVVAEVSKDPVVNDTIRKNLRRIAADPELHAIVWSVVKEAVLQNKSLHDSLDEYWNSPEARQVMQQTSAKFEPTARKIGDLIIGSREEGITPEMARILRLQILMKDRHWLVISPVDVPENSSNESGTSRVGNSSVRIVVAGERTTYPITFDRADPDPLPPMESAQ